jgi:hypothetical protein
MEIIKKEKIGASPDLCGDLASTKSVTVTE